MKLEAYWIINNLACCDENNIMFVLGDNSITGIAKGETLNKISSDMERIRTEGF